MALSCVLPRRDFPRTIPEALLNLDPRDVPPVVQSLQAASNQPEAYDQVRGHLPANPSLLQFMDWLEVWDFFGSRGENALGAAREDTAADTAPQKHEAVSDPGPSSSPSAPDPGEGGRVEEAARPLKRNAEKSAEPALPVLHTFLRDTTTLSGRERFLYLVLLSYQGQNAESWPSQATLASICGCSVGTLQAALSRLVEKEYLQIRRLGRRKTNRYTVMCKSCALPTWWIEGAKK